MPYTCTPEQLNSTSCDDERKAIVEKLLARYESERTLKLSEGAKKNFVKVTPTTKKNLSLANIPKINL